MAEQPRLVTHSGVSPIIRSKAALVAALHHLDEAERAYLQRDWAGVKVAVDALRLDQLRAERAVADAFAAWDAGKPRAGSQYCQATWPTDGEPVWFCQGAARHTGPHHNGLQQWLSSPAQIAAPTESELRGLDGNR